MELLSKDVTNLIRSTLKVARILKLESIAIEKEQIRSMSEARTVMVLHKDMPELPFGGIGIGRVTTLLNRFNVMGTDCTIGYSMVGEFVKQLDLETGGSKIEYRCANPTTIKCPRNRKSGNPDTWEFVIDTKTVDVLVKAAATLQAPYVQVKSNGSGQMTLTVEDSTRDKFVQRFDGQVTNLLDDDGDLEFEFLYSTDVFLTVLKHMEDNKGDITLVVSQEGLIQATIEGITIYLVQCKDES